MCVYFHQRRNHVPPIVIAYAELIAIRRGVLYHKRLVATNAYHTPNFSTPRIFKRFHMSVTIKTADEIEKMRIAGRLAADVLVMIEPYVQAGITSLELDTLCHDYIVDVQKAIPAPLNYRGFPKSICTSVNQVVCHGIPNEKKLKKGDIVNIDITVIKDGYHGDTSKMFAVDQPSIMAKRLMNVTQKSLWIGIEQVKPGRRLGDIGHAIQTFVEAHNYSVVREYCGHGIGKEFHEDPQVLHYGNPGTGLMLEAGMCFTIEPMVNAGKQQVKLKPDGWTVVTRDRSLSAQYEHTLLVTETGCEVLTLRDEERDLFI
jgi:methionyl aminopeptidase